jgi:excisionase family DNA binding protein
MLSIFTASHTTQMDSSSDLVNIMTIKEVSDFLKVTERTIYRLAAGKQIPAFKVGGSWRFSRSEIDQWIKSQSSMPMDQADD